ncbi:MAG: metalloregulator ArsR/SmtB family transcription factor [Candidatus Zixiibacteriota bacterium]
MNNYAEVFKALADKTRLRIMRLLSTTDRQVCVCELVDALKLPQYQVSKHLNVLKNAGLVEGEKRGTWVYYSLVTKGSSFNRSLFRLLEERLSDRQFSDDAARLKKGLKLGNSDVCVVGPANRVRFGRSRHVGT